MCVGGPWPVNIKQQWVWGRATGSGWLQATYCSSAAGSTQRLAVSMQGQGQTRSSISFALFCSGHLSPALGFKYTVKSATGCHPNPASACAHSPAWLSPGHARPGYDHGAWPCPMDLPHHPEPWLGWPLPFQLLPMGSSSYSLGNAWPSLLSQGNFRKLQRSKFSIKHKTFHSWSFQRSLSSEA